MSVSKYFRGLWLLHRGRQKQDKNLTQKAIKSFTVAFEISKQNHNITFSEACRLYRAHGYVNLFNVTEDIDWINKAISDLSTTYEIIDYETSRPVWMNCRSVLASSLTKFAAFTGDKAMRDEALSKALHINDELFSLADSFSKSFLRDQYFTQIWIYAQKGNFAKIASIYLLMIDDEKIKLTSFEKHEKRIEYVDQLCHQFLFSTDPNFLTKLIDEHIKSESYELTQFNKNESFKLLKMRAKNSWLMFKCSQDPSFLKRGLADIERAIILAQGRSRITHQQKFNVEVEKFRFQSLLASEANDESSIHDVIMNCSALLQKSIDNFDEQSANECRGVLAFSYLTRSKINGGNAADVAEARRLILTIEESESVSSDVSDYDLIESTYKKEIKKVKTNKTITSSIKPKTDQPVQPLPFVYVKVDICEVMNIFIKQLASLASMSLEEFEQAKTKPSKKFLLEVSPLFESHFNTILNQQKESSARVVLESILIGELGKTVNQVLNNDILPIVQCLDNHTFVSSYSKWKNLVGTPFNILCFREIDIPEPLLKLYYYVEFYNDNSNNLALFGLGNTKFGAYVFDIKYNYYLANQYIELDRKNDAIAQVEAGILVCCQYLSSEDLNLSSSHRHELLNGLARLYIIEGELRQKLSSFDTASNYLEQGLALTNKERAFDAWLENRRYFLSAKYKKWNLTQQNEDWVKYVNSYRNIVNGIPFESYPAIWCDIQFDRCLAWFRMLNDFEPHSKPMLNALAQFFIYHKNVHILIRSTSNLTTRRKYIQRMSEFGDILPLLSIKSGYLGSALATVDMLRGLRLTTSLKETNLPSQQAIHVKQSRLKWENATQELERASYQDLNNPVVGDRNNPILKPNSSDTREAFQEYKDAIKSANIDFDVELDTVELVNSIPVGSLICLPILSEIECAVVLIGRNIDKNIICEAIPLKNVKQSDFDALLKGNNGWLDVYRDFRSNVDQGEDILNNKIDTCEKSLQQISGFLGKYLIQPIHDYLQTKNLWGHIDEMMFVPTGALSMLPIHAAKFYSAHETGAEQYLIESVAVSMWPTLSSIVHGSRQIGVKCDDVSILLIDSIKNNKSNIPSFFTQNNDIAQTIIDDLSIENFSLDETLESLSKSDYSYFYCHGHWDNDDPENSSLELIEGEDAKEFRLSVHDIRQITLYNTRLLFLGACETSMIGVDFLPNEFVGLPAAFMEAGLRGVVSTQWMVHEDYCLNVADAFFEQHIKRNIRPAIALQKAILKVSGVKAHGENNSEYSELMFWAPFVIYGS